MSRHSIESRKRRHVEIIVGRDGVHFVCILRWAGFKPGDPSIVIDRTGRGYTEAVVRSRAETLGKVLGVEVKDAGCVCACCAGRCGNVS